MKILVIEDEKLLLNSICQFLQQEKYIFEKAETFSRANEKISLYQYDIVLLDINLPDGNGLDLIEKIKAQKIGLIIISAKNGLEDKIIGLENGADDYLSKPFHLSELNARIRSVYRRINFKGEKLLVFNEISLDKNEMRVFVNEKIIFLTKKEFDMLEFFIVNKNRLITKTVLGEYLWGDYVDSLDSLDFIYTHIKNLRKKLSLAKCKNYIKSIYGVGYKFCSCD